MMASTTSAPNSAGQGLNRRRFLATAAGTAGVAGLAMMGCSSSGDTAAQPTTTPKATNAGSSTTPAPGTTTLKACKLTPEMTSGPYYLDGTAVRSDITEDREGFPLEIAFTVIDSKSCEPIPNAAVDIWHCDANGEYAGWNGNTLQETFENGRNELTYLRGIQETDENGVATFTTIYPGWYEGRAIHIHLKVHTDGEAAKTYEGGHVNHVGQVFFSDAQSDELMKLGVYADHPGTRTRNDEDTIYLDGGADQIVTITPSGSTKPEAGFKGAVTLAIDPDAVPEPLPVA